MNKCTTIIERRKELIEVSKMAKAMRAAEEIDGTINYVLLNYIYITENANEFKTFEEWQKEGFGVRKGAKAFVAWGKPREKKTDRGDVVKYYPITYLFSDLQVYKRKREMVVKESGSKYENFVGEIKVSYKRHSSPVRIRVNGASQVNEVLREVWNDDLDYRESFNVLAMNNQCDILGYAELFKGGVSSTIVDERMVFQLLLNVNATGFIVAHNHPSGTLRPSNPDRELTKKLSACGKLFNIGLMDHLILAGDSYYSFAENGEI